MALSDVVKATHDAAVLQGLLRTQEEPLCPDAHSDASSPEFPEFSESRPRPLAGCGRFAALTVVLALVGLLGMAAAPSSWMGGRGRPSKPFLTLQAKPLPEMAGIQADEESQVEVKEYDTEDELKQAEATDSAGAAHEAIAVGADEDHEAEEHADPATEEEEKKETVTCSVTALDAVESVWYNGQDITSTIETLGNVTDSLANWGTEKKFTFPYVEGARFVVIAGTVTEEWGKRDCDTAGFAVSCTDPRMNDQANWRAIGSQATPIDYPSSDLATTGGGNGTICSSTGFFWLPWAPTYLKMWVEGGNRYAGFQYVPPEEQIEAPQVEFEEKFEVNEGQTNQEEASADGEDNDDSDNDAEGDDADDVDDDTEE